MVCSNINDNKINTNRFIVVRSCDLHPLAKPSSMRLPTSISKSLWRGRTNTPLTTFYKWFTLLQIFKEKEGGEHSSNWKQKLAKDFAKTVISISCFSKCCILCWELRGIYRPQEDSNLGSKFWILLGFRGWRCHRLLVAVPSPVSVWH